MTQDEIIKLAEQANGEPAWNGGVDWTWDELKRFAKLVAQHERERCAELRKELTFFYFDKPSTIGKQELVGFVNQALDDYAKLIRTGNV